MEKRFNWAQFHRDLDRVVAQMLVEVDKRPSKTSVMELIGFSYEKTKSNAQFASGSKKKVSLGSFQGLGEAAVEMTDGFIKFFTGLLKIIAFAFISILEGFKEFWGKERKKEKKIGKKATK